MNQPKLLDTVELLEDLPSDRLSLVETNVVSVDHLPSGLVGTIVHIFHQNDNEHYLIEFADVQGREYATATLAANEFLILHQELQLS
ncbi:MAG: DUF4926 domain-containing protein [Oscillatoriales cyanobacterium C42_A2020_001]|nr:DUF4926 domain-containing protein [Leptolyngbyaceae cyanobacterium C42_A2020_001]